MHIHLLSAHSAARSARTPATAASSSSATPAPAKRTECIFYGMSAGAAADHLFLANNTNRVVRIFDVRSGQLDARDVYRCPAGENNVRRILCAHRHLRHHLRSGEAHYSLVRPTNSEWRVCHRLDVDEYKTTFVVLYPVWVLCECCVRALSDASLCLEWTAHLSWECWQWRARV